MSVPYKSVRWKRPTVCELLMILCVAVVAEDVDVPLTPQNRSLSDLGVDFRPGKIRDMVKALQPKPKDVCVPRHILTGPEAETLTLDARRYNDLKWGFTGYDNRYAVEHLFCLNDFCAVTSGQNPYM